jgi:hypothetical protein
MCIIQKKYAMKKIYIGIACLAVLTTCILNLNPITGTIALISALPTLYFLTMGIIEEKRVHATTTDC